MRYAREHKAESRLKIVQSAARDIRLKGPDRVGVAEVMASAGLTHGAFYAHFPSKDALVAEAIEAMFNEPRRLTQALDAALADPAADLRPAFRAFVRSYLSPDHRDQPERGCPLPSLAGDVGRAGGSISACFSEGVERLSSQIAAVLDRLGIAEPIAEANATLAQMAGAIGLARAVRGSALSDVILRDTFTSISARFSL